METMISTIIKKLNRCTPRALIRRWRADQDYRTLKALSFTGHTASSLSHVAGWRVGFDAEKILERLARAGLIRRNDENGRRMWRITKAGRESLNTMDIIRLAGSTNTIEHHGLVVSCYSRGGDRLHRETFHSLDAASDFVDDLISKMDEISDITFPDSSQMTPTRVTALD